MTIHLPQLNKSLDVDKGENLFTTLKNNQVPIASSCGGEGICGKCIVNVSTGSLPPESPEETELKKRMELASTGRLSCQIQINTDLTISTTYW